MRSQAIHIAIEGWNFCNRAGPDADPSPRYADCLDRTSPGSGPNGNRVRVSDNQLTPPQPIPGTGTLDTTTDKDLYAEEKERYLGDLCHTKSLGQTPGNWSFWTLMIKSGNFDPSLQRCLEAGRKIPRQRTLSFQYGHPGPMNQPVVRHQWSSADDNGDIRGSFNGSYDNFTSSFFSVHWSKSKQGSWLLQNVLKTGGQYPYLMLYNRADSTQLGNGGYPWEGRGVLLEPAMSPGFVVQITLNVTECNAPGAQFYMPELGGCWKNNGQPCDGDLASDCTRYICFIINPGVYSHKGCKSTNQNRCPPYHTFTNGTRVYRNDTERFPYECYYLWCAPPNSDSPVNEKCDPYSNPMSQELVQILPCREWGEHGFPAKLGGGWVGDARSWTLQAGDLASRVYFTGEEPHGGRKWLSVEVGPEVYQRSSVTLWEVSGWDVLQPTAYPVPH
jgi:hypothetical protein